MERIAQNYQFSCEYYDSLTKKQKERISVEMLYNAICHFHDMGEQEIVKFLMELPEEEYSSLEKSFRTIRRSVKEMVEEIKGGSFFDDIFKSGDIEDILFYQVSNDLPIE